MTAGSNEEECEKSGGSPLGLGTKVIVDGLTLEAKTPSR